MSVVNCAFICSDSSCIVIVFFLLNVIMQLCQHTLLIFIYVVYPK